MSTHCRMAIYNKGLQAMSINAPKSEFQNECATPEFQRLVQSVKNEGPMIIGVVTKKEKIDLSDEFKKIFDRDEAEKQNLLGKIDKLNKARINARQDLADASIGLHIAMKGVLDIQDNNDALLIEQTLMRVDSLIGSAMKKLGFEA